MTTEMRTDIENLKDGERVTLYPNARNPLHHLPVKATHKSGLFYCDGSNPVYADYWVRDVLAYNDGFTEE